MKRSARLAFAVSLALARGARSEEAIVDSPHATGEAEQTIRFDPVRPVFYLDPDFDLSATATSRLPVSFTASGDCTVSGRTVHILSAGKCFLTAQQPGDATYAAAPDADQRLSIAKARQKISFPLPPEKVYLDPDFDPGATASSGLPITFFAWGDCSVDGSVVHILGAGECSLTANQPGDDNFTAAKIVDLAFQIAKADQTIEFVLLPNPASPGIYPLSANASSGLPVSFEAWGSCIVTGPYLQLVGLGACTLTALQPGDRNFNPAPPFEQTFGVDAP